jgi:hypothetical protein
MDLYNKCVYTLAALIGETPIIVLPHLISNFVRFQKFNQLSSVCNSSQRLVS